MTAPQDRYATLDGLRGAAAIMVVTHHAFELMQPFKMRGAFLAVDLFFILSGFVIAKAYDRRFEGGMTPWRFFVIRLIRLWPLYILGTAIGLALAGLALLHHAHGWTWPVLATTAPFSLLMLPNPFHEVLYPVNQPAWSLLFELLVNLAYAVFWKPLQRTGVLLAILAMAGAGLVYVVLWEGSADVGFSWPGVGGGLIRAVFGFTLGVTLRRLPPAPALPGFFAAVLMALSVLALLPDRDVAWAVPYNLAIIMLVFPVGIWIGASVRPGGGLLRLCSFLGLTSYAVYAVHRPLIVGTFSVMEVLHIRPEAVAPWSGAAFILALIPFCWIVDRVYDTPFRAFLTRRLTRNGLPPATQPAAK
ncbi:acyltransferase [soil metagenome]